MEEGRNITKHKAKRIVLLAFAITGLGYISAVLSRPACEVRAARMLMAGPLDGKHFYLRRNDKNSIRIFRKAGGEFTQFVYSVPAPHEPLTWPDGRAVPSLDDGGQTAYVSPARVTFPFLVSVRCGAQWASLAGHGGTTYYIGLFGIPIKIFTWSEWVS
jgi:hypothetical protein